MRSVDLIATSFGQTALILTFSPREKEHTPLRDKFTRYRVCFSLPLGETLAHTPVRLGPAVRAQEWVWERVRVRATCKVMRYRMAIG